VYASVFNNIAIILKTEANVWLTMLIFLPDDTKSVQPKNV